MIPETELCQFVANDGWWVCSECGYRIRQRANRPPRYLCRAKHKFVADESVIRTPPLERRARTHRSPETGGPGTELHAILKWFGIEYKAGCKCKDRVALMNAWGPDRCERRIATILGWMRKEARKRKLPFSALGAKLLVRWAIRRARKLLPAEQPSN